MTAKEFVQEKCPTAMAERHVSGRIKGFQKIYWLIRERGDSMYMAQGTSESNAWVNAKKYLQSIEEK